MYLNTLICLEENVAGYGRSNKSPSGHVTIMSPGMIKCYIQNLRSLPKEYTVYLISKSQNKAVRLGNINTEDTSKQTTWKIELDNLQGTGIKGKDIDCVAVVVEGDTIGNTDTVLIGYAKDKYLITTMLESALPKKQSKPQVTKISKAEEDEELYEKEPCGCGSCECEKSSIDKLVSLEESAAIIPEPDINRPGINESASLGEGPAIIPMPDTNRPGINEPISLEGGSEPVIISMSDTHKTDINEPASLEEGSKPIIISTLEDTPSSIEAVPECNIDGIFATDELVKCIQMIQESKQNQEANEQDEIKVLMRLQNMFSQSLDKESLAARVQSIIEASTKPLAQVPGNMYETRRNTGHAESSVDEEQQYLNQIENVLKSIQQNLGGEAEEKKILLKEELLEEKGANYKRDLLRVRDIFMDSTEIEPFEEEDANVDWVRISMAELISMPQFSYEWCTNPFVTYCYHKFGFLILGKDKQIEQYYVGVPDIYDTKRKFILSIDKIESFKGRSSQSLKPGDYGYWIVRV